MSMLGRIGASRPWPAMHTWPSRARWLATVLTFAVLAMGFWLLVLGGLWRVLGLLTLAVIVPLSVHVGRALRRERSRTIERRYARQFAPAMLAYMLLMLYVWPLQKTMEPGWLKLAATLLPVLPIVWCIVASIRYVLGNDELERRQHLEALAISVAIVGVVGMVLGFLAAAKILVVDGAVALLMVYPALCLTYGAAHCWLVWCSRAE